jgi:ABC-2 type transport system ATP-binding protein
VTADADRWGDDLGAALVELGVERPRADALAREALDEAAGAVRAPREVFGPALLYARQLRAALQPGAVPGSAPVPEPAPAAAGRDAAGPGRPPGRVALDLHGVGKRYGRRVVLADVTFTVRSGEVAAVVGSNGSGKSTLLRVCAGLARASSGTVRRVRRVGYVPQQGGVAPLLTVHEHLRLVGAVHGVPARRAVATGELLASRLGFRPRRGVVAQDLSGGTRQKLNLVLGELDCPDLLLLDEPYQGFDQGSYVDFWDQVEAWRGAGAAVVVVTHLLHELDRATHVVELATPRDG